MEPQKQALRVYKSLLLHDIPDDLIDLVIDFTGNISQSPYNLENRSLTPSILKRDKIIGHYCRLCDRFYETCRTERGLQRHFGSQKHRWLLYKHMKNYAPPVKMRTDKGIIERSLRRYMKFFITDERDMKDYLGYSVDDCKVGKHALHCY